MEKGIHILESNYLNGLKPLRRAEGGGVNLIVK